VCTKPLLQSGIAQSADKVAADAAQEQRDFAGLHLYAATE
jgi:hypothetical protein